jgi:hypothetical protein
MVKRAADWIAEAIAQEYRNECVIVIEAQHGRWASMSTGPPTIEEKKLP